MPTIEHHHGCYVIHGRNHGKNGTLVQSDWDYPATARDLGWNMRRVQPGKPGKPARILDRAPNRGKGCDHSGTDGTITCPDCGVTASDFIAAAGAYLDSIASF